MKPILKYIVCVGLLAFQACSKKTIVKTVTNRDTVTVLNYSTVINPVDSIAKMQGIRLWHGQYLREEYDSTRTHIVWVTSDTSLSFGLTVVNDSLITCNVFNGVDSLGYYVTDEPGKCIFYVGHKFGVGFDLYYYYLVDSMEFKMDGVDSNIFSYYIKLHTP